MSVKHEISSEESLAFVKAGESGLQCPTRRGQKRALGDKHGVGVGGEPILALRAQPSNQSRVCLCEAV